ncbi:MAG TPA: PASTA domain-containing protein [Longimicrobiaceae bacterium]|nr:PASTA domain-containing protein [Longimicrobiaceae bacterium]
MRTRRWERGQLFRRRDTRLLLKIVGVGIVAFLLGYALMSLIFFNDTGEPTIATVPDLRRQPQATAERELERASLEMEVRTSLVHPDVPKGAVLAQSPLPGQEVAPGSIVEVILSAGRDRREVPRVQRLSQAQATRALASSGFDVTITEVQDTVPAGQVISVSPAAGTLLELPAIVSLTVSTGPPLASVPMVVGLPQAEARTVLEDAGFKLGEVRYESSWRGRSGIVIAQEPRSGELTPLGSAIEITVSEDRFIRRPRGG